MDLFVKYNELKSQLKIEIMNKTSDNNENISNLFKKMENEVL